MSSPLVEHVRSALDDARVTLDRFASDAHAVESVATAAELLAGAFRSGGRVLSCGNGGSMCDAMHFAEELSGRFRLDRKPLPALAISDPSHMTCTANDYGFDEVFARYVEAHGRKGDVLLAISTSGRSPNIINAAKRAKSSGVKVIGLTGRVGSELAGLCDVEICAPAGSYSDRVQEIHIKVVHMLVELVERQLFPANYAK